MRERRTVKQKVESARAFSHEATNAVEDLLEVMALLEAGRDPKAVRIPSSVIRRSGTREEHLVVGYSARYWDMCAVKVKTARRFLGALQSHCRQLARAGLRREGKR